MNTKTLNSIADRQLNMEIAISNALMSGGTESIAQYAFSIGQNIGQARAISQEAWDAAKTATEAAFWQEIGQDNHRTMNYMFRALADGLSDLEVRENLVKAKAHISRMGRAIKAASDEVYYGPRDAA